MGVHGLWRLIEPSGKPVPLETLENKILAVDISIWLHQAVKGFQDARGAPLPNAHLLGIYHRLCKLLYFRIKPVFVFDGGVPLLKKQTIAKRSQHTNKIRNDATSIQEKILSTLLKHSAIQKIISEKTDGASTSTIPENIQLNSKKKDDLFYLPSPKNDELDTTVESDSSDSEISPSKIQWDLHTIDEKSVHFKSLPAEVRHDILTDLKDQRKQSSWGRLHELPKQSGDFSSFQMKRLLKRYSVQVSLEEATQEMGGHSLSLNELEALLTEQGVVTASNVSTKRIASNENRSYLLIKDVKKAMEKAKEEDKKKTEIKTEIKKEPEEIISEPEEIKSEPEDTKSEPEDPKLEPTDSEFQKDLQEAIKQSLIEAPSTSKTSDDSFFLNFNDGDFDSESSESDADPPKLSAAQSYMLEYSDLTPHEIAKIIGDSKNKKTKSKKSKLFDIPEESQTISAGSDIQKEKTEVIEIDDEYERDLKAAIELSLMQETEDNTNEKIISKISDEDTFKKSDTQKMNDIEKNGTDKSESANLVITEKKSSTIKKSDNINLEMNASESDNEFLSGPKTKFDNMDTENKKHTNKNSIQSITSDSDEDFISSNSNKVIETNKSEIQKIVSESDEAFIEVPDNNSDKLINKKSNIQNSDVSDTDDDFVEVSEIHSDKINTQLSVVKTVQNSNNQISDVILSTPVEIMSDSDESDFVDVEEKTTKSEFAVVINPISQIEDDIFADIFSVPSENKSSVKITEIIEEPKIVSEKISEKKINIENKKNDEISVSDDKSEDNAHMKNDLNISEKVGTNEIIDRSDAIVEKKKVEKKPKLSLKELNKMKDDLVKEQKVLTEERNAKERMAGDITTQMYEEAQELLELFGMPYVVAPMEAEAQCAFLNLINLTDGTITDDSDIWLFGGQTVYKNFFNQKKHVMEYRAERIEQYFKLTREQMILLALLVGSDYTIGIQGIGPVTALEILASFPPAKNVDIALLSQPELISGLLDFKQWLRDGRSLGPGRTTLRSKLQNIQMAEGFPNLKVVQAYLQPEVETCRDKFSWGKPDIVGLTDYAREKFGWSRLKTEEILKPVIKRLEDTSKQKSIKDYFSTKHKMEVDLLENANLSKRVKMAINKMGKSKEEPSPEPKKTQKRKVNLQNLTKPPRTKQNKEIKKKTDPPKRKIQNVEENLEIIPQRENDKVHALRSKLKAIEVYRKSKIDKKSGKHTKLVIKPKDDAELSESSDSS